MTDPTAGATIDERRAAALLGLTPLELRWFSRFLGLGSNQLVGDTSQTVFTFEDLKRLSSAAACSAK
jgi:hypothetical protein